MTMNQCFTFPWQLTLRSIIDEGCGIVEEVEKKYQKLIVEEVEIVGGLEKTEYFNSRWVGF